MDIKTLLDNEIDILLTALDRLKIYDISLSYAEDGQITAKDYENQWTAKEFYEFLLNDAISYEPDGTSAMMAQNTLLSMRRLGEYYGAVFPFMEQAEEQVKVESPRQEADTFTIYQLKDGEALHYHRFEPLERLEKSGLSVEPDNYSQVYTAPLPEGGSAQDKLNRIYEEFNLRHPAYFRGHSLSVSDIVVFHENGRDTAHYVDRFGFEEVPQFIAQEPGRFRYYITQEALNIGTYPYMGPTDVTRFTARPHKYEQGTVEAFGYVEYPSPLPPEQSRSYALIPAAANEDYLKNAEVSMEINTNMIDGILNNLPEEKKEPEDLREPEIFPVELASRFKRHIKPEEITPEQLIIKGGIVLTPCASNPEYYESTNRNVAGRYIDAQIYEVARRNKRGKPAAFRVAEGAAVENPLEPTGKMIGIAQSGGIVCGLAEKYEMEGFVLADKTVLLEKERDAHGNYYAGISLDGMMLKLPKMYAAVTDEKGNVLAFREMHKKDFSREEPPKKAEKKPSIREQLGKKAGRKPERKPPAKKKDHER